MLNSLSNHGCGNSKELGITLVYPSKQTSRNRMNQDHIHRTLTQLRRQRFEPNGMFILLKDIGVQTSETTPTTTDSRVSQSRRVPLALRCLIGSEGYEKASYNKLKRCKRCTHKR
ncbi:unnamed protein product [Porites lobata]|uniref:Uncharacterized protein n=1 Tax=Porites lobata TaxID=104759 RepID=A0ABN8QWR0_9CNID|nr:unnamed protein product [Porites lobata]